MIYPPYSQFRSWIKDYKTIPFCRGPIDLSRATADPDIYPVFKRLARENCAYGSTFYLDSFNAGPDARYSFFPLSPAVQRFTAFTQNSFKRTWDSFKGHIRDHRGPRLPVNLPPFYGGAVGYLSYDCGRTFEEGWQTPAPSDTLGMPLMEFAFYDDVACLDHAKNQLYMFSCLPVSEWTGSDSRKAYEDHIDRLDRLARAFLNKMARLPSLQTRGMARQGKPGTVANGQHLWFNSSVVKIKDYISAGDIYQANLSQRIASDFPGTGLDLFGVLREINPSPYSCYLRFPARSHPVSNFEISSCSPELLIKKRGNLVETRPIAGTRPRGRDVKTDRKLKGELLLSEKERAEHIMLLDLERNDLGRVCESGSVKVFKRMAVEKYSHVMHIVSRVRGTLKREKDFFDAVTAVFPGGTITGCPKVRCMEILDEMEPVSRGPFFGSAGWIGYQGDGELNLLIRTAVVQDKPRSRVQSKKRVTIQVGSGIVADSDPEMEYRESLQKAAALLEALGKAPS